MGVTGGEAVVAAGDPTVVDEVHAHVVAVVDEFFNAGEAPIIIFAPGAEYAAAQRVVAVDYFEFTPEDAALSEFEVLGTC